MQKGTSRAVNGSHGTLGQGHEQVLLGLGAVQVAVQKPTPSPADAEHIPTPIDRRFHNSLDGRIQARDITPTCQNTQFPISGHLLSSSVRVLLWRGPWAKGPVSEYSTGTRELATTMGDAAPLIPICLAAHPSHSLDDVEDGSDQPRQKQRSVKDQGQGQPLLGGYTCLAKQNHIAGLAHAQATYGGHHQQS